MKKRYLLIALIASILFIPKAFAAFYYIGDDSDYVLCPDDHLTTTCFNVSKSERGLHIDSKNKQVSYKGVTFVLSEDMQNIYNSTQVGKTTMVYYINRRGKYALCDTLNTCYSYTYDDLVKEAAIIVTGSSIAVLRDGVLKTYYYNDELQEQADNGREPGKIVANGSSNNNSNNNQNPNNNDNQSGSNENQSGNNNQNVNPATPIVLPATGVCSQKIKEPLRFVGRILLIVKIIIPIIIIIFGIIDFFKAIVGAKDEEIKKSARSLLFRAISGVIIFLIPTIVSVIFSLVDSWGNIKGDFDACQKCILRVNQCE